MNRQPNFDQLMREWVDVGEEGLPLHHLDGALAAIEITRQRGARRALLEDFLMRLQPLAAPLAIAAALAVAIGAAAIVSQPAPIGPEPTATQTPAATTPTVAPTATATVEPTATPRAFRDFSALEGEWEGMFRRGGAGGLEFRIVAVIRAGAETNSPIARVTHYQGAQSEPFCEGDWFAIAAEHPEYQVGERMADEACVNGTVDLTYDPGTRILSYRFTADHGAAAGFATGELSRIDP